jgi:2,3,4,5-tetrahydropyridine-2-carboxylate N-succinyltransferase
MARPAAAAGLATFDGDRLLDAWFPSRRSRPSRDGRAARARRRGRRRIEVRIADLDAGPADAADAYLRLHLLSHRLAAPNSIRLDGIFGVLANVAWTDRGPLGPRAVNEERMRTGEPCGWPPWTSSRG